MNYSSVRGRDRASNLLSNARHYDQWSPRKLLIPSLYPICFIPEQFIITFTIGVLNSSSGNTCLD